MKDVGIHPKSKMEADACGNHGSHAFRVVRAALLLDGTCVP